MRPPGLKQDITILKAEVIEAGTKPSVPIGEIGKNSFGEVSVFENKGDMRRAVVAHRQTGLLYRRANSTG
jgi:predicted amino acid racemase